MNITYGSLVRVISLNKAGVVVDENGTIAKVRFADNSTMIVSKSDLDVVS